VTEETARTDTVANTEAIKTLYQLWSAENNTKTQKLAVFFIAQSILAAGYGLASNPHYLVPAVGVAFSFFWFFSIGRTLAFQQVWRKKIEILLRDATESVRTEFDFYPTSRDKSRLPLYGRMPSTYILLLVPTAGFLAWLGILAQRLFVLFDLVHLF